ncbi:MAG: molybdate ABC transporter substrate-binding protein [Candidatus Zipacnadales bacterium]
MAQTRTIVSCVRRWIVAVLLGGAMVGVAGTGCRKAATVPAPTPLSPATKSSPQGLSGKLTILIPCGQLGPFMDAKPLFQDKHPGVEIEQIVENINVLRAKILDGRLRDADVFLDMGDTVMRELIKTGKIIEGTDVAYAQNYLTLIVPAGNPAGIKRFEDLGKPQVRAIGLAEPKENSNGEYAVEALKNAGLWDSLNAAKKIVTTPKPAQLKGMVGNKKVDAAFIYTPCAYEAAKSEKKPKPQDSLPQKTELLGNVPEDLYTPFYCTAGVLVDTDNEAAARAFVEFLNSDEASEIWQNWHFGPPKSKAEENAAALFVHCGAGLRPPMDELAALFEKRTGIRVDMAYKGSGCLLADIQFSHKGDLYMPGETEYMDQAQKRGFIVEQRPIATMETVIITPKKDRETVKTLQDLAKPGLKVGLGAMPQVAVGIAAKRVLSKAGLWEAVQKNVTMNALNVIELANSVKLDGLDAAIVWNATARLVENDVNIIPIDPQYTYRSIISLGTLKFSRHSAQAQLFLNFVSSAEGQEIFRKHGYLGLSSYASSPQHYGS